MRRDHERAARLASVVPWLWAGVGMLLIASLSRPWTASGVGSATSGRRVADLVLSGRLEAWAPRWSGVLVYGVALAGASLVLTAGLRSARSARLGLSILGGALSVGVLHTMSVRAPSEVGAGGVVALTATALGLGLWLAEPLLISRLTRSSN